MSAVLALAIGFTAYGVGVILTQALIPPTVHGIIVLMLAASLLGWEHVRHELERRHELVHNHIKECHGDD